MTPIVSTKADNAPNRNWGRLMIAAQMGNAKAYRMLLSERACWLRRYYARRLPPAMTEDAVQDVLLAIHERRHTYDPGRPLEPWLAAIARYKWIDHLRSLRFTAAEPLDENIGIPDHGASVIAGSMFQQLLARGIKRLLTSLRLPTMRTDSLGDHLDQQPSRIRRRNVGCKVLLPLPHAFLSGRFPPEVGR